MYNWFFPSWWMKKAALMPYAGSDAGVRYPSRWASPLGRLLVPICGHTMRGFSTHITCSRLETICLYVLFLLTILTVEWVFIWIINLSATQLLIRNLQTRTLFLVPQYYYSWQYCELQESLLKLGCLNWQNFIEKTVTVPDIEYLNPYWDISPAVVCCANEAVRHCYQWQRDAYFGLLVSICGQQYNYAQELKHFYFQCIIYAIQQGCKNTKK